MSVGIRVQSRRGTTAENNAFTGALGEVTVDTTKNTLRVHDGSTAGGKELARSEDVTAAVSELKNLLGTCSTASATATKETTIAGFVKANGVRFKIKFDNDNTTDAPSLSISDGTTTTALSIVDESMTAISATNPARFPAGCWIEFFVYGDNAILIDSVVKSYKSSGDQYEIRSNGKVRQSGKTSNFTNTPAGSSSDKTVTLPVAMKDNTYSRTACLAIDLTLGNASQSGFANRVVSPSTASTTTLIINEYANAASSGTSCYAEWVVEGYKA